MNDLTKITRPGHMFNPNDGDEDDVPLPEIDPKDRMMSTEEITRIFNAIPHLKESILTMITSGNDEEYRGDLKIINAEKVRQSLLSTTEIAALMLEDENVEQAVTCFLLQMQREPDIDYDSVPGLQEKLFIEMLKKARTIIKRLRHGHQETSLDTRHTPLIESVHENVVRILPEK